MNVYIDLEGRVFIICNVLFSFESFSFKKYNIYLSQKQCFSPMFFFCFLFCRKRKIKKIFIISFIISTIRNLVSSFLTEKNCQFLFLNIIFAQFVFFYLYTTIFTKYIMLAAKAKIFIFFCFLTSFLNIFLTNF